MGFLDDKYGLPTGNFGSRPNTATFGTTEVITNKPIITTNKSLDLPIGNIKRNVSQAEKDFNARMRGLQPSTKYQPKSEALPDETKFKDTDAPKESWWKQRTKTQKTLIIGGSAVGVLLLTFVIYKAVKK